MKILTSYSVNNLQPFYLIYVWFTYSNNKYSSLISMVQLCILLAAGHHVAQVKVIHCPSDVSKLLGLLATAITMLFTSQTIVMKHEKSSNFVVI